MNKIFTQTYNAIKEVKSSSVVGEVTQQPVETSIENKPTTMENILNFDFKQPDIKAKKQGKKEKDKY